MNVFARNQTVRHETVSRGQYHDVRALRDRLDRRRPAEIGKRDLFSHHGLHVRQAARDQNHFGIQTVFLVQIGLVGHPKG